MMRRGVRAQGHAGVLAPCLSRAYQRSEGGANGTAFSLQLPLLGANRSQLGLVAVEAPLLVLQEQLHEMIASVVPGDSEFIGEQYAAIVDESATLLVHSEPAADEESRDGGAAGT